MTDLDAHFEAIGLAALRSAKDVELIARANSRDNFTVHFARVFHDAIVGAWDLALDEHVEWANQYALGMRPAHTVPIVRRICSVVYGESHQQA